MTAALSVGLDIGATKTLGLVLDPDGGILAEVREPTKPGADGVVALGGAGLRGAARRDRAAARRHASASASPAWSTWSAAAVKHAVNLGVDGDWLPLRDLLADRLGVPVVLENDVNAATLGAAALSGADDLVYLSIGTGLAAGLVLDGRLRRGEHGAAGEIGHVPVDPAGRVCQCGQRGCLETIASGLGAGRGLAVRRRPARAGALRRRPRRRPGRGRGRGTGSPAGVASAIRVLGLAVDPASIVLGGGVAQVGEPLRLAVAQALLAQAASSPFLASLDLAGRLSVVPLRLPGRGRRRRVPRPMSHGARAGLVDLQVNGAAGIDLTAEPHRLWEVAAALPAYGVVRVRRRP